MNTAQSIAENFTKLYSTDGHGDDYPTSLFSGLTLGVVVDTDDPLQAGRLRIFCPSLNDNPKKAQHLPWASYVSPFSGSINNSQFYRGTDEETATSTGSVHYGFWAIPEMGAHVLVGCIDGDPRRRFWIGCVPEHQETNTIHHGRYKWDNGSVEGPLTGSNSPMQPLYDHMQTAFDGKKSSPEFRSRVAEYQASAINQDVGQVPNTRMRDSLDQQNAQLRANDPDTWEHATLGSHGYDWSGFKSLGGYMSSRVFGWSTPGMHAITMDDRPFNSRVRLRTTAGHQILIDDSNERIYIATYDGNNYIEMDRSGNIDLYSAKRISVHAEEDINFNTKKSFRVLAEEGIYMYAGIPTNGDQVPLEFIPDPGEIRIHSHKDMHLLSEGNMRQLSFLDTYHESSGNLYTLVEGSMFTQVGQDINVTTDNGSYNATIAANINETAMQNSKRFTYGASSMASNLQSEVLSFQSTVAIGGNKAVNIKSNTADVNIDAQGQGDGTGAVNIKSPNSQASIGDQGIEILSDKSINVKSQDSIDVEINPDGPKLAEPTILGQIPDLPSCDCGLVPEIQFDGTEEFLSAAQAAIVAYNAGFRGRDLIIAVALMGTSNFATGILQTASQFEQIWSQVVGPFQIRTLQNPDRYCGVDSYRDNRNGQLQDPNANARLAYRIFNESYPQGAWSANKWPAFAGNGSAIMNNLSTAIDAVAGLCNMLPSDIPFPALPPLSLPALNTAMSLTQTGLNMQGAEDIIMKSMANPASYTTSYNNMVDTINATVIQGDQLSWMSGTFFPLIVDAIEAIDGSLSLPFTFDIAGLLSTITSFGIPDINSLLTVPPLLPISLNLEFPTIAVLDIPPYDDIVGNVYSVNSIDLNILT